MAMAMRDTRRKGPALRRVGRDYNPRSYRGAQRYANETYDDDETAFQMNGYNRYAIFGSLKRFFIIALVIAVIATLGVGWFLGETKPVVCSHCGREITNYMKVTAKGIEDHGTGYVLADMAISFAKSISGHPHKAECILCEKCYQNIQPYVHTEQD